jgi:2-methylcitrate dehydratase PrpD
MSYCAQLASGCGAYMHDRGHIEKAFVYAGKSAQNGVAAATMVTAGFTGADDVFSGDRNFLDAYGAPPHRGALIDELGIRYEIVRTNIKKWCVGSPIQPALDGIDAVFRENGLELPSVERVEVRLAPEQLHTVDNRPMPNVNIQHLIALLLVRGTVGFVESHDASLMQDADVLAIRQCVSLVPDEALEHARPPRQTIVEVTTRDGRHFSRRVVAVRGTPDNPMSRNEVIAKAHELIAPILGARRCRELVARVLEIETVTDMALLRPLLSAGPAT